MSNDASQVPAPPPGRRPLFLPRATTLFRVALLTMVLLTASAGYAVFEYYHSPYWNRIGLAPDQPVLFSHRHHAGELRIDCRFCHASVESAAFAGMPATQTCLNCHSQLFTDTAMLQPVVRSAALGEPLEWNRVTRLPDHVFFNHGIHVAKGVGCATCHGDLARMALTAKVEPLDMRWCVECHRGVGSQESRPGAPPDAGGKPVLPGSVQPGNVSITPLNAAHLTNCSTCHH